MLAMTKDKPDRRARGRGAPRAATRRCIASGELRPKQALLRFVAGPEGTVVPDLAGDLPGRGLWLSPRRTMIQAACARNLFARAARAPLKVPEDLPDRVEALLARRCVDLLGLARRGGLVSARFVAVAARIAEGKAGLVLQAADGASGGRAKLRGMARARGADLPVLDVLSARELGRAFGQGAYVHVCVERGRLARRLRDEVARLTELRDAADVGDRRDAQERGAQG